jgi:hypothetical protein
LGFPDRAIDGSAPALTTKQALPLHEAEVTARGRLGKSTQVCDLIHGVLATEKDFDHPKGMGHALEAIGGLFQKINGQ